MTKKVEYIGKVAFQGDVGYIPIKELPEGIVEAQAENGQFILGHSETGHHHVIERSPNVKFFRDPSDAVTSYLQVIQDDVKLLHLRKENTHAPHTIAPGVYKVINGVEHRPEGWRRMSD